MRLSEALSSELMVMLQFITYVRNPCSSLGLYILPKSTQNGAFVGCGSGSYVIVHDVQRKKKILFEVTKKQTLLFLLFTIYFDYFLITR